MLPFVLWQRFFGVATLKSISTGSSNQNMEFEYDYIDDEAEKWLRPDQGPTEYENFPYEDSEYISENHKTGLAPFSLDEILEHCIEPTIRGQLSRYRASHTCSTRTNDTPCTFDMFVFMTLPVFGLLVHIYGAPCMVCMVLFYVPSPFSYL